MCATAATNAANRHAEELELKLMFTWISIGNHRPVRYTALFLMQLGAFQVQIGNRNLYIRPMPVAKAAPPIAGAVIAARNSFCLADVDAPLPCTYSNTDGGYERLVP